MADPGPAFVVGRDRGGRERLMDLLTLGDSSRSDGFPRVIPIGFYWNGNQIVVCTATTAPKAKALSSRPNVAITMDQRTPKRPLKASGAALDVVAHPNRCRTRHKPSRLT